MVNVGVLVGSLSKKSYSQKIANYLMSKRITVNFVQVNYEILPLYNPDLEQKSVLEWEVFRNVVHQMDALLIVTPEYNLSIPGGLKNAVDVLSVSMTVSVKDKPVLLITDSSGNRGGANANIHIQQLLRYMGMNVMNDFITIGDVQNTFDSEGKGNNKKIVEQLDDSLGRFIEYVKKS